MSAVMARRRDKVVAMPPTLNLVSLMDIFTILVFFLMVNASEIEVLETTTAIRLPDSIALDKPEHRLVIEVEQDTVHVNGKVVMTVNELMEGFAEVNPVLKAALGQAVIERSDKGATPSGVNLMGDRSLPYALLKRIMSTCQDAALLDIALAVNQVAVKGGES